MTSEERNKLANTWVANYRKEHPRSRAIHPYRISRNGGKKRVYESLIDGSVISMCAEYPITKRVLNWMDQQYEKAAQEMRIK
jgi:hypothetical protein